MFCVVLLDANHQPMPARISAVVAYRQMTPEHSSSPRAHRGFLNAHVVHALAFWIVTGCIVVAVVAAILAIWEFTKTDVLWRTVATCLVVGVGTLLFAWVNGLFGDDAA